MRRDFRFAAEAQTGRQVDRDIAKADRDDQPKPIRQFVAKLEAELAAEVGEATKAS